MGDPFMVKQLAIISVRPDFTVGVIMTLTLNEDQCYQCYLEHAQQKSIKKNKNERHVNRLHT